MRSGANLRGGTPLVSFNHVIDPHFVAFSNSLYTTVCNPNPQSNPNPSPNNNRNPTVITDPQTGPRDPQIVTVQNFRSAPQIHPLRILSRVFLYLFTWSLFSRSQYGV